VTEILASPAFILNTGEGPIVPMVLEWAMFDGVRDPNWAGVLSLTAHEVRNPMTVIIGYLRMLQGGKPGDLTERQAQYIELILKSCGSVRAVTDQLSELSRIEDGRWEPKRAPVDLRELIAGEIAKLPELSDRQVSVELCTGGDVRIEDGDPGALALAFSSLLGRLRTELVTSTRLLVRTEARDAAGTSMTWIGIGGDDQMASLDEATPATLVEFEQKERSGWGLRLVIAQRIIEAHGGALLQVPARVPRGPVVVMLPRASAWAR
jgi:K+-sensing histidine kinase KdpD